MEDDLEEENEEEEEEEESLYTDLSTTTSFSKDQIFEQGYALLLKH